MEKKVKLKGHETFCLREGWLQKGMEEVQKNQRVFSVMSGADALGVGSNMAKAIRYWLKASLLAKDRQGVGTLLTEFGEMVYECDPYVEEFFTLWCLHINLASNKTLATSWYVFFNQCKLDTFTRSELELVQTEHLCKYAETDELSERSIKDDCSVILQMYAREYLEKGDPEDKKKCPFTRLGLLRKNGNTYKREKPDLRHFPEEVVLYLLAVMFEGEDAISMEEFYHGTNGVAALLGIGVADYQDCLDELAKKGYLLLNRTAGLDMIYWNKEQYEKPLTKEQVMKKYYEN